MRKKTLSIVMLLMLLISNAGTPIAYSIDLDDILDDVEKVVSETSGEDWDFTGGGGLL